MNNVQLYQPSVEAIARFSAKDSEIYGARHFDYAKRRFFILDAFFPLYGKESFPDLLIHLYQLPMSADEIAEEILKVAGVRITPRSISRTLNDSGIQLRKIKEAFGIAMSKGRVKWAYREHRQKKLNSKQLPHSLRLRVLELGKSRCKICGATSESTILEVDHIVPRSAGGSNDLVNLRVLCHECNVGKRVLNKEGYLPGHLVSGSTSQEMV
jgi:hypothetical protein